MGASVVHIGEIEVEHHPCQPDHRWLEYRCMSEAMVLATKAGVDPERCLKLSVAGLRGVPY